MVRITKWRVASEKGEWRVRKASGELEKRVASEKGEWRVRKASGE